jgi:acyl-CoA synthetase (NDP forming)
MASVGFQEIVTKANQQGRTALNEVECKQILKEVGIPATETKLAASKDEAISLAVQLGYPVVLKIVSPDIIHKSDIGGVILNLGDESAVASAYDDIMAAAKKHQPSANIEGVSVQPMARPGTEVIVGMSKDPQFGPVLMFGLGGVLVEILKDVSFRIVPLTKRDAQQMVKEIKAYPVLEGYRGSEPAHIQTLEDILLKLSEFVDERPEIQEIDLNPIFAYQDGAVAVDARIILESPQEG